MNNCNRKAFLCVLYYLMSCHFVSPREPPYFPDERRLYMADLKGVYSSAPPATIEEFPFLASIQFQGYHMCTGFIYSSTIIVTSKICTFMFVGDNVVTMLSVRVGSSKAEEGGKVYKVKSITATIHKLVQFLSPYADQAYRDVAMVETAEPIKLNSKTVNSVPLSVSKDVEEFSATKMTVVGWALPMDTLEEANSRRNYKLVQLKVSLFRTICSNLYYDYRIYNYERACFTSCYHHNDSSKRLSFTQSERSEIRQCKQYLGVPGAPIYDHVQKNIFGFSSWGYIHQDIRLPVMFTVIAASNFNNILSCIHTNKVSNTSQCVKYTTKGRKKKKLKSRGRQ